MAQINKNQLQFNMITRIDHNIGKLLDSFDFKYCNTYCDKSDCIAIYLSSCLPR